MKYKAQELYNALKSKPKEDWEISKPSTQDGWREYLRKYDAKYDKVRKLFFEEYKTLHKFCPKCGDDKYCTTLLGCIFDIDKMDTYKDRNMCTCSNCGDKHMYHDRVETQPTNK